MARPNIQIDDLVREMTEEEYEQYLLDQINEIKLPTEEAQSEK